MQDLYDFAMARGVQIEYRNLAHLGRAGDYHAQTQQIRLQPNMLYRKERSVLAHELAHHVYADEPDIFGKLPKRAEDRADEWAAHFLIDLEDYIHAEERFGTHTEWIADELCVLDRLVKAYERTLTRIGDSIYVNPKLGYAAARFEVA